MKLSIVLLLILCIFGLFGAIYCIIKDIYYMIVDPLDSFSTSYRKKCPNCGERKSNMVYRHHAYSLSKDVYECKSCGSRWLVSIGKN